MDKYAAAEYAYRNGYEKGHDDGYLAGKEAATEQIFADLDKLYLSRSNKQDAEIYNELKKRYGVV